MVGRLGVWECEQQEQIGLGIARLLTKLTPTGEAFSLFFLSFLTNWMCHSVPSSFRTESLR